MHVTAERLAAWARTTWRFRGQDFAAEPLAGDASPRRFFRLTAASGQTLVGLWGPDPAENQAYLNIGRHLWFKSLPLPRLWAADLEAGLFLMEDLGDRRLAEQPEKERFYPAAAETLARLHQRGLEGFNPAWCHQTAAYDQALIYEREFRYFLTEMVAGYLGRPAPPAGLKREGRRFAALALAGAGRVLMHRDFQSRNLMLQAGRPFIIDWQGARPGPAAYDLASLLEDPYVELSEAVKADCLRVYLKTRRRPASGRFRRELTLLAAARLMQALGAYAKLARMGKNGYRAAMLPAARRLKKHLDAPEFKSFPTLRAVARDCLLELEKLCLP